MKRRFPLIFSLAVPVVALALAGFLPANNREYFTRITATLARELPREHLSRREISDAIVRQTIKNYLTSLDFDRSYFLLEDIEQFEAREADLHDRLLAGDNSFAFEVYEIFKERVRDRTDFVDTLLAEGFDFTVEEEYHWKRRNAPWSVDRTAWNELWRKRVKNEYLRRVLQEDDEDETAETDASESQEVNATEAEEAADAPQEEDTSATDEGIIEPLLSPSAFIQNRYLQYRLIIEDADAEWILQKFLSSFARAFDPHCDYMFPSAEEDFEIEMKLSLVGIGALLRPEDGAARIVSLIPGGPASADSRDIRLRPGDKIVAVAQGDEEPVSILHWPLYRSVRLIRGELGTRVVLTVIPASDPSGMATKTVDLIRDEVKLEEREARSTIHTITGEDGSERRIGVITLPTFYADMQGKRNDPNAKSASRDVAVIIRNMRKEGIDAMVLDLRGNGGGSLIEAILMTGLFIEAGPVVQVRERRALNIIPNNDPTVAYNGPLAVIVNRVSASASEILAAALQDYGRALIIGDSKTHGKGSVQSVTPLSRKENSGSIKVTSALFYRISGGSTQLRGVTPDIVIPSAFDFAEFGEEFLDNPLEWTTVRPAMFSVFSDIPSVLDAILEKSEHRREQDPRYMAKGKMLERIRTMNEQESISLHIEHRREHARVEKELTDIQNQLMDQTTSTDEESRVDLVKEETMRILADWIKIREAREKEEEHL